MQFRIFIIFCFFIALMFTYSCGNRVEGCLDINAVNFDVEADKDCCCTYPDLILNFNHVFGDTIFRLGNEYSFELTDTFIVEELRILMSNAHPVKEGVEYQVDDTLFVNVDDGLGQETLELEDNFLIMSPEQFSYSINSFSQPGTYEGVVITSGLGGDARRIVPDSIVLKEHPLIPQTDTLWNETVGYFYWYLKVIPDKNEPDISREFIIHGENSSQITLSGTVFGDIGYDLEIDIEIDYENLLDGIDFEADNEITITQKLIDNLPLSLSLLE